MTTIIPGPGKGMSTTNRFNPSPNADYGQCNTCGISIPTKGESESHMAATSDEAKAKGLSRSHSVRVPNPSREHRIESTVSPARG